MSLRELQAAVIRPIILEQRLIEGHLPLGNPKKLKPRRREVQSKQFTLSAVVHAEMLPGGRWLITLSAAWPPTEEGATFTRLEVWDTTSVTEDGHIPCVGTQTIADRPSALSFQLDSKEMGAVIFVFCHSIRDDGW